MSTTLPPLPPGAEEIQETPSLPPGAQEIQTQTNTPWTPPGGDTTGGGNKPWTPPDGGTADANVPLSEGRKEWQNFTTGLGEMASPVRMFNGIKQALTDPKGTFNAMHQQYQNLYQQGMDALHNHDYAKAFDYLTSYITPVMGPQIQEMENLAAQKQIGRVAGQLTGLIGTGLLTEGLGAGAARLGRAAQATRAAKTAAPAAEAAEEIPIATEAESAAEAAKAGPNDALQQYMDLRNKENARIAYQKASPTIRQQIQQQHVFQTMKAAGGDVSKFGELMDDSKNAIPLADHQTWDGIKKAIQSEMLHSAIPTTAMEALAPLASHVIPALGPVMKGAGVIYPLIKIATNPVLRAQMAQLAKLTVGSPAFETAWNAIKTGAARTARVASTAPVAAAGAVAIDRNKVLNQAPDYWGGSDIGKAQGGPIERIKQNTLRSLYGGK